MVVTLLIATLCVSVVGLVSLITVKRWEMTSGRVVMGAMRPKAGKALGEALHFAEAGLPFIFRRSMRRTYAILRSLTHRLVAWTVLHTERWLERTLRGIRGATQVRGEGEVSDFLREVAEHKRSLLKKSAKSRAIYEE